MPTALRTGPCRFCSYSHEASEPEHIHVDRDRLSAKLWLRPLSLARNLGSGAAELGKLQSLGVEHQERFLEAWDGPVGKSAAAGTGSIGPTWTKM